MLFGFCFPNIFQYFPYFSLSARIFQKWSSIPFTTKQNMTGWCVGVCVFVCKIHRGCLFNHENSSSLVVQSLPFNAVCSIAVWLKRKSRTNFHSKKRLEQICDCIKFRIYQRMEFVRNEKKSCSVSCSLLSFSLTIVGENQNLHCFCVCVSGEKLRLWSVKLKFVGKNYREWIRTRIFKLNEG